MSPNEKILSEDFIAVKNKFVLSHPIAGSERSGLNNSKKELFDNKVSVISPHETNDLKDIDRIIKFWNQLQVCKDTFKISFSFASI